MAELSRSQSTLKIPDHWTPETAEAAFLFLHVIIDAIWERYGDEIMELTERETAYVGEPYDPDDHGFDPF